MSRFNDLPTRTGLVLGKFLPPHAGHQYLFDFAGHYVSHLNVLVCSLPQEPIAGTLRTRWVREMCPAAEVFHVTDPNPQEPHQHPDFWQIWTDTVRRRIPYPLDVVFTSEDYGDELARRLGARHVIVDKARELVPISGTQLCERPWDHWQYLPPCVRPHFVRRVVVHGPESTGKTTLCRRLAEHYGTVWASEYARGMLDHRGGECRAEDIVPIARGHLASQQALARQANRILFSDTDALLTEIYSELYFGSVPDVVKQIADSQAADLYLVTNIDVPWVADVQRDLPHRRPELREKCLAALESRGRKYVIIQGDWEERFRRACAAVDRLLTQPMSE